MTKSSIIGALALSLLVGTGAAQASKLFQAVLTHDQEVIAGGIPDEGSGGVAIFILNDAGTRLTYDVKLFGLDLGLVNTIAPPPNPIGLTPVGTGTTADPDDDVLRGHIHRAITGLNGGIVFGFIDGSLALLNDQNDLTVDKVGLHITGAWDLNEGNPNGISAGVQSNLGTELGNLLAGGLYINFHTRDHAGGEIRGQILRVPEPASLALMGLGLLGIAGLRRRAL